MLEKLIDEEPSFESVCKKICEWKNSDYYKKAEKVNLTFRTHPKNESLKDICPKIDALNSVYHTRINKKEMGRHIYFLKNIIDEKLAKGDLGLVNDIMHFEKNGKRINYYCFATKYCHLHNPLVYPIYDFYVSSALKFFKKRDTFYSFYDKDLKCYPKFKEIVDKFREHYKLEGVNYQELDVYLWFSHLEKR